MATVKHLILDINVIIDLWLNERSAPVTEELFQIAATESIQLWMTATSLGTLDYVARCAFKRRGMTPEGVAKTVPRLVADLLGTVAVLTSHGFEQPEIYRVCSDKCRTMRPSTR